MFSSICQNFSNFCFKDNSNKAANLQGQDLEWGQLQVDSGDHVILTLPVYSRGRAIDPKRYFVFMENINTTKESVESDPYYAISSLSQVP